MGSPVVLSYFGSSYCFNSLLYGAFIILSKKGILSRLPSSKNIFGLPQSSSFELPNPSSFATLILILGFSLISHRGFFSNWGRRNVFSHGQPSWSVYLVWDGSAHHLLASWPSVARMVGMPSLRWPIWMRLVCVPYAIWPLWPTILWQVFYWAGVCLLYMGASHM